ncbi:unnamed protein product [Owenia fusiformis]|uniref:Tubulin--tyrosine ligase-like protein 12 SET-like domain-containing protein n=1 Tax=Owenia fusiformis TaxID=6347 RepID=A0A8S4PXT0_OWEFU|nr:unnamed protein product [Owenia fusiformis]
MPHVEDSFDFPKFVELHKPQLDTSGVPERYWETLYLKLKNEVFDAGSSFGMMKVLDAEDEDDFTWRIVVTTEDEISLDEKKHIYLIDHAWTYRLETARQQLTEIPGLVERMCGLMDLPFHDNSDRTQLVEDVLDTMWRFNQTYKIGNAQHGTKEAQSIWYILDEFGSRIQHSENPTVRMVPFFYAPSQISYTIMWPVTNLAEGDEVCRNYVESVMDPLYRKLRLLPWQPNVFTHHSYKPKDEDPQTFSQYRINETLPEGEVKREPLSLDRSLKVYCDVDEVKEYLTDSRFELIESEDDADILWVREHYKDYKTFAEQHPQNFINQYPYDSVITNKDLLTLVAQRSKSKDVSGDGDLNTLSQYFPKWLQVTYNLETELAEFVSYYQHRENEGLDNHWICKPWNMGRGLDLHITNNLNYILRLPETGPKIVSKYIEEPVLFYRDDLSIQVKFDIRFHVLLASVNPLKIYVYEYFLVRFSQKPFSLDHFDEHEKHFTVHRYEQNVINLNKLKDVDFIPLFNSQYSSHSWDKTRESMHAVIKDVFECSVSKPPPQGMPHSPQSRELFHLYDAIIFPGESMHAVIKDVFECSISKPPPQGMPHSPQSRELFGIDMMLKWATDDKGERYMQPVLLEVNYVPQHSRICSAHPETYNDTFAALFLGDLDNTKMTVL